MFIYPVKSVIKYNINGKNIIMIGERHTNQNKVQNRPGDINIVDFYIDKIKTGYEGVLELSPEFKNNIDMIIKNIDSKNIIGILKEAKKNNLMNKIHGVDFRSTSGFFGRFGNINVQSMFFNLDKRLMIVNFSQFIQMIDDMMVFINKYFYDKYKILIEQINQELLIDMFNLHKKIDVYNNEFKKKIKPTTLFGDMAIILRNENQDFGKILREYRDFIRLFSDIMTLIDILHKKSDVILLIGNNHVENMSKYLSKYEVFPAQEIRNNKKLSNKEKQMLGKEVRENVVYISKNV